MAPTPQLLRFELRDRPTRASELTAVARAQLVAFGETCDGESLPADARLEGAFALSAAEHWAVVDPDGRDVFAVWCANTDSGAVFRAGTTDLVGLIVQFGFACTDLAAWEQLAEADRSAAEDCALQGLDLSLDEEAGPSYALVPPAAYDALLATAAGERRAPDGDALAVGSAWRGLRVVVAPWDPTGAITQLITASGPATVPGLRSVYGAPLAYFPPDAVRAIAEALARVPSDAVEQQSAALAEQIAEADYREPAWLRDALSALSALVRRAAREGAGLLAS